MIHIFVTLTSESVAKYVPFEIYSISSFYITQACAVFFFFFFGLFVLFCFFNPLVLNFWYFMFQKSQISTFSNFPRTVTLKIFSDRLGDTGMLNTIASDDILIFILFLYLIFYLFILFFREKIRIDISYESPASLADDSHEMSSFIITKTCQYIFDPLKPHFYIVKLGFTGVYIIFLIFAQNIYCGYSLEPPRRGGSNEYPQYMFWAKVWKISEFFIWIFSIFGGEIFYIFE